MDLIPPTTRAAAAHLVAAIEAADWHLTTGFVGVGYLLPALSATGDTPVAYRLLAQRSGRPVVHARARGDHDLGTLGRLVAGARIPVRLDELLQRRRHIS